MDLCLNMTKSRKHYLVNCSNCAVELRKRADNLKNWSGICQSCNFKLNSQTPSMIKARNPDFVPERKKLLNVNCEICKKTYQKTKYYALRYKGRCASCAIKLALDNPKSKAKLSEHGKNIVAKMGGKIPNAKHFTSERMSGSNNWNWNGGTSSEHDKVRGTIEILRWKKAVLKYDNYTCVVCRTKGVQFEIDHIKPFSLYPNLRTDINNGRTLCKPCHKEHGAMVARGKNIIKEASGFPLNYYTNFHLMA